MRHEIRTNKEGASQWQRDTNDSRFWTVHKPKKKGEERGIWM